MCNSSTTTTRSREIWPSSMAALTSELDWRISQSSVLHQRVLDPTTIRSQTDLLNSANTNIEVVPRVPGFTPAKESHDFYSAVFLLASPSRPILSALSLRLRFFLIGDVTPPDSLDGTPQPAHFLLHECYVGKN